MKPIDAITAPTFATSPNASLLVRGTTHLEYLLQLDKAPENATVAPQIKREIRAVGGAAVAALALANWGVQVLAEIALAPDTDANARFIRRALDHPNIALQTAPPLDDLLEQAYRVQIFAPQASPLLMQRGAIDENLHIILPANRRTQISSGVLSLFDGENALQVLAALSSRDLWQCGLLPIGAASGAQALRCGWSLESACEAASLAMQITAHERELRDDFEVWPTWNAIDVALSQSCA